MTMATLTIDMTSGSIAGGAGEIQVAGHKPALPAVAQESFSEGLDLLNTGYPGEAASFFEKAIEAAPDFADGHVALGIAYAVVGKVYPALDHLQAATRLDPPNFYAHFKLGQLYFKLRVTQKGYDQMRLALNGATSLAERRLVAELLREERQREGGSLQRPRWFRPFSTRALALGTAILAAALCSLALYLR